MNLTVRMKIIGGFSTISILLFLTSMITWLNLDTINESTLRQSELAIPTLKSSNNLATELSTIGNQSLRGYYQTELAPLNENLQKYESSNKLFTSTLKKLKRVVQNENTLLSNLKKIDNIYFKLQADVSDVFNNRKISIEQQAILNDKIDALEERADDAVTLLLDLADHDLADSRLQRAISLGEVIETQFNNLTASALEYKDVQTTNTSHLIESEMSFAMNELNTSVREEINELNVNNVGDVAESLETAFVEIQELMSETQGILFHKKTQLNANQLAQEKLAAAELDINAGNKILKEQMALASETTTKAGQLVADSVSSGTTQTIGILLISIFIAFFIARFTLISITRPLGRVNEMLKVVSSGDLSRKLDESGTDEFATLSKNCNLLIDSLRTLIQGIVSRSTQLAAAAEQTSAVTAQSTTAIEEQRNQVEQAASATTEMSSTSQSVLTSANDALGEIKQADDEAERIKIISEKSRQTIELLASEVDSASQVINKLQQDSASIGSILDVIRGIAEQTNLLALNAAIEAARAGEQGRGFAVVADEVRTLASRTQESTQEIQKMIEVLQDGAEQAVNVMNAGKKQAASCVEQSEITDKALDAITHAVHEAFDRSSQIATAAEEQSVVAHEISENLESIVAIAEQTTAGSQQTAASSSEVARLSEELQQSVQEFKLESD
ncbi:MAG: methyl-accepting chemotaxis protein [Alteromonadaceae bacterium]|nr:methyl-accepting chemotaxis protein [Alteromonadaceae bacterium]